MSNTSGQAPSPQPILEAAWGFAITQALSLMSSNPVPLCHQAARRQRCGQKAIASPRFERATHNGADSCRTTRSVTCVVTQLYGKIVVERHLPRSTVVRKFAANHTIVGSSSPLIDPNCGQPSLLLTAGLLSGRRSMLTEGRGQVQAMLSR